jgi:alpha-galactosidase
MKKRANSDHNLARFLIVLFYLSLWLVTMPAVAVTLHDAAIEEIRHPIGNSWKLANARIELEITYTGQDLLLTRLRNPATAADWSAPRQQASIAQLVRLRWEGKDISEPVPSVAGGFQLTSQSITSDERWLLLELVFTRQSLRPKLAVSLFFRVYPSSFIETWNEVENAEADASVEVRQAGRFRIPMSAATGRWEVADSHNNKYEQPEKVTWLRGLPEKSLEAPLMGTPAKNGLSLGHHGFVRSFFLRKNAGESLIGGVYFGHRAPIGFGNPRAFRFTTEPRNHVAVAEIIGATTPPAEPVETLHAGPGQTVKGLTFIFAFAGGDLQSASIAYHELATNYLMPPAPIGSSTTFPWISYNPYFAYDLGWDVTQLKANADIAATLGVELFVIDAGWWEGSLKKSGRVTDFNDYLKGASTYTPDHTQRFPSGGMTFLEFSNYVHEKGMKFGLWVCPFDVEAGHNTGWDPAWLAPDRKHLCSADKAAFDWVKDQTSRLVDTYHIDYLKFDCESPQVCGDATHNSVRQAGAKQYVIPAHQGYDDLVNELRLSHPTVAMEDDLFLGNLMLSADDWDLLPEHGRIVLKKDRFIEPPQYTGVYLMHEPLRDRSATDAQYRALLKYVVRSSMLGHITLSSDLTRWSNTFREIVKQHVQLYRDHRPVLTGSTYELAFDPGWDAVQFHDSKSGDSIAFIFRKRGPDTTRLFYPQHLQPERNYRVSFADNNISFTESGRRLMKHGIRLTLREAPDSEIVSIHPQASPDARRPTRVRPAPSV